MKLLITGTLLGIWFRDLKCANPHKSRRILHVDLIRYIFIFLWKLNWHVYINYAILSMCFTRFKQQTVFAIIIIMSFCSSLPYHTDISSVATYKHWQLVRYTIHYACWQLELYHATVELCSAAVELYWATVPQLYRYGKPHMCSLTTQHKSFKIKRYSVQIQYFTQRKMTKCSI